MKTYFFKIAFVFAAAIQLICCGGSFPAKFKLELPEPPNPWISLLGNPYWHIEWLNPDGEKQAEDIPPGSGIVVEIPITWANPVTAWPFWPNHNLIPGHFKPAGALFPFDIDNNRLRLSWESGPDTIFYWELALANAGDMSKLPSNFDWSRFRNLFKDGTLKEEICIDPWVVDWRSFAKTTVNSTFYSNRLSPAEKKDLNIPVSSGTWYGSSPFAKPLYFAEDDPVIFEVRTGGVNVWISKEGILRVNGDSWVFYKMGG